MTWIREARPASRVRNLTRTLGQTAAMWTTFLAIIPAAIHHIEQRLHLPVFPPLPITGWIVFTIASVLGLWTGIMMAWTGDGTPWPRASARKLVIRGPYRWVRNPMAVAGLAQGLGIALVYGSWAMVLYVLAGGILWNTIARPIEERDLRQRFGEAYQRYQSEVRCWIPRF